MHKANSIGIGSIGAANQRAISGTAFMSSEKAIEIIDAPAQGMEVCCVPIFIFILVLVLPFGKKCGGFGFGFGEKQWPLYNAKCCCDEQLRRSTNDAQIEEIRRLKQQLALKDRRIHELEEQLQRYKNSFIGDSTAWWAEQLASVKTPSARPFPANFEEDWR